ncbi:hypothetical protein Tco_1551565, partial [Tanacetum coccineum]
YKELKTKQKRASPPQLDKGSPLCTSPERLEFESWLGQGLDIYCTRHVAGTRLQVAAGQLEDDMWQYKWRLMIRYDVAGQPQAATYTWSVRGYRCQKTRDPRKGSCHALDPRVLEG